LLKTVLDEEQMGKEEERERESEWSWSLGHIIDNVEGTTGNQGFQSNGCLFSIFFL